MVNRNPITSRMKRAIIEVSLIVVGVSIALAGDAWLADRAETVRTDLLLDSLEEVPLRMAIASWRTALAELDAEQAALRELGTIAGPRIASKIAQRSGEAYSSDLNNYSTAMGMELGDFALAAFSDDEWVAHQRHLLNLMARYRGQVDSVRDILEQNLALLRERDTG
jgi:hypothetical protein